MKKILTQIAKSVRKNAVEGAGAPSYRYMYEGKVSEKLIAESKKSEKK